MASRTKTDVATRALIVTLNSPVGGLTTAEIVEKTGISKRTIDSVYTRAIKRGFDPNHRPIEIRDEMLQDTLCSRRPRKRIEEIKEAIITKVQRDRYSREKSCANLTSELSEQGYPISRYTVWRVLK
jgi:transposase